MLPGAGAVEMELAYQVRLYADKLPGLEQYGAKRFAIALEGFVKILADNTGVKSNETLAELYSQHSKGNKNAGFNIEVSLMCSDFDFFSKLILNFHNFFAA